MRTATTLMLAAGFLSATITIAAQSARPPLRPTSSTIGLSSVWTDDDYDAMMKQIGAGAANLRKLIDSRSADAAEAQAESLNHLLDDVEEFWIARKVKDAEEWAEDAQDHADHIEDAVDAKDFAKAEEHLKLLMATCQSCHAKYREQLPGGSYQIKKQ